MVSYDRPNVKRSFENDDGFRHDQRLAFIEHEYCFMFHQRASNRSIVPTGTAEDASRCPAAETRGGLNTGEKL
jgi:hypothetical protein